LFTSAEGGDRTRDARIFLFFLELLQGSDYIIILFRMLGAIYRIIVDAHLLVSTPSGEVMSLQLGSGLPQRGFPEFTQFLILDYFRMDRNSVLRSTTELPRLFVKQHKLLCCWWTQGDSASPLVYFRKLWLATASRSRSLFCVTRQRSGVLIPK